ncbi:MAG: hypothetical protein OXC96_10425 [Cyanobacteria bacterium MAG CAR1_bin_15]|nr:hypothetical protein [Cyanobacteria bacterium MAG CAR1_bin_15]
MKRLSAGSLQGKQQEAEVPGTAPPSATTYGNVRLGFVHGQEPHITFKSIANNREIDVIWEKFQKTLEPQRSKLNAATRSAAAINQFSTRCRSWVFQMKPSPRMGSTTKPCPAVVLPFPRPVTTSLNP